MSLKPVLDILNKISSTTKRTEKLEIIQSYRSDNLFKKVVTYALDYNKVFNVTNVNFIKNGGQSVEEIFNFLDKLSTLNGATKQDKETLSSLASIDNDTIEVINRIIQKDLKCGASLKTFLKVFPNIPYFELMTCKSDIPQFIKLANKNNFKIMYSDKLDGCRNMAVVENNHIKHLSRSGIAYYNFNLFNEELHQLYSDINKKISLSKIPFDGEVTVENGNFNDVMKHIRTINDRENINFQYNIFDIAINLNLLDRLKLLKNSFKLYEYKYLKFLDHVFIANPTEEHINKILKKEIAKGYEGIVLKIAESPYEFKEKSKYWCKVKPTDTLDLLVVGKFEGEGKFKGTLGGLIVKYKNNTVNVGSGFTDNERNLFYKNPPKIIEVKIKEITKDNSLREPIFVRVRCDKETLSDEE